jgi:hypothetical protein
LTPRLPAVAVYVDYSGNSRGTLLLIQFGKPARRCFHSVFLPHAHEPNRSEFSGTQVRIDYVYRQRTHATERKTNGKLMREERRDYLVTRGAQKHNHGAARAKLALPAQGTACGL